MKDSHRFDCVKMKHDIQREIAGECAGIPESEALDRQRCQISRNRLLVEFVSKARRISVHAESTSTPFLSGRPASVSS